MEWTRLDPIEDDTLSPRIAARIDNSNEMNAMTKIYSVHISGQLSSQATEQAICVNVKSREVSNIF